MTKRNSERFLDAFVAIEEVLRRVTSLERGASAAAMLSQAVRSRSDIRRFQDDIRRYTDLRNAIVHERGPDMEPIAEPHDGVVAELERIADLVASPPRLDQLQRVHVKICAPSDSLLVAATAMLDGHFSQLPVYEGSVCEGVLTSETIARWLAAKFKEDGGVLDEPPVAEVLPFREPSSIHEFVARDATIVDALDRFDQAARNGRYLDALIVTHSGRGDQKPVDILTVFDLPRLHQLASHGIAPRPG